MESWRRADVPALPGRGPETRVRNTATGDVTVAARDQVATLYACGITPYDATHIGHAATFIAWDLLVRAWLDAGHDVTYVQNVTDVDDPLLERADRDGEDWRELAAREIDLYRQDMSALRVLPPAHLIGAVEALPVIERFNERLAARGALYDLDEDVYFARSADPAFGLLSGPGTPSSFDVAKMTKLCADNGGDPYRTGKKDPLDPLAWRGERQGEPSWESKFGRGRPGWHVECAAIASEYLGTEFDVQAGGADLIFPHHEMSGSHARVAFGDPAFARVYAHAGLVRYQGAKMSKSLGNLVFVSRLREAGTDPMAIRLAILAHHYRSEWEWTDASLAEAQTRLTRWRAALTASGSRTHAAPQSDTASPSGSPPSGESSAVVPPSGTSPSGASPSGAPLLGISPSGKSALAEIRERLADDLDAPGALAAIDRWSDAVLAGSAPDGAPLVRAAADALLGIAL